MNSKTGIGLLARLRVLVAHLGEVAEPAWWNTTFTTEAGLDFSKYNFTHSYAAAAVAGATMAARKIHDDRIGKTGTRHLFRFDGGLERAVHREILEAHQDELVALLSGAPSALAELELLARQTIDAPDGPVQIGRLGQEEAKDAASELAAHYLSGFSSGRTVFPYFAAR